MRWTCSYFDYHFSILIAILSYSFPNYWRQLISLLYVLQLHMNLQALQIKTLCSKIRHKNVLSKCSKRFKCLVSLNGNIQCMDTGPHTTLGLTLTNASSSSLFYNVEFKINHTALFLLFFCKQTVLMCHSNFSSSWHTLLPHTILNIWWNSGFLSLASLLVLLRLPLNHIWFPKSMYLFTYQDDSFHS